VIVYDTMWETTEMMAKRLAEIFAADSVDVKIHKIRNSDGSQIVRDVLDAKVVLIGSPTLNADVFWTVGGFLTYLRGLKPKHKKVGIFGSYGWSEAASKMIRRDVEMMGLEMIEPPFEVQYIPTEDEMGKLDDYGRRVLEILKSQ
jgi:flavorubredoxin